jgi:trans-2,3-dihydro-3-hydroxyanthranilate isomerase
VSRPFHIVDVFAEERYAGNQLAVVCEAGDLSGAEMQRIAAEMNYSETAFIESEREDAEGYPVRIFTPASELLFAGHPTLGTACVLQKSVLGGGDDNDDGNEHGKSAESNPGRGGNDSDEEIPLSLGVGRVPVTIEGEGSEELLRMSQPEPTFGERAERTSAAGVLSLGMSDLDGEVDPQVVSTGLPTLVVALRSLAGLRRARIGDAAYEELLDTTDAENVLAFCPETVRPENDLHVRVFAPAHAIPEDPATGSSNGCLAAYLARERFFNSPTVDVRVEQGYELDRPSLLFLRASDAADGSAGQGDGEGESEGSEGEKGKTGRENTVGVSVGGRVIPVAKGELL